MDPCFPGRENSYPATCALVLSGGGGADLSDTGRAGEAYEAGLRQARLEVDRIREVWNG